MITEVSAVVAQVLGKQISVPQALIRLHTPKLKRDFLYVLHSKRTTGGRLRFNKGFFSRKPKPLYNHIKTIPKYARTSKHHAFNQAEKWYPIGEVSSFTTRHGRYVHHHPPNTGNYTRQTPTMHEPTDDRHHHSEGLTDWTKTTKVVFHPRSATTNLTSEKGQVLHESKEGIDHTDSIHIAQQHSIALHKNKGKPVGSSVGGMSIAKPQAGSGSLSVAKEHQAGGMTVAHQASSSTAKPAEAQAVARKSQLGKAWVAGLQDGASQGVLASTPEDPQTNRKNMKPRGRFNEPLFEGAQKSVELYIDLLKGTEVTGHERPAGRDPNVGTHNAGPPKPKTPVKRPVERPVLKDRNIAIAGQPGDPPKGHHYTRKPTKEEIHDKVSDIKTGYADTKVVHPVNTGNISNTSHWTPRTHSPDFADHVSKLPAHRAATKNPNNAGMFKTSNDDTYHITPGEKGSMMLTHSSGGKHTVIARDNYISGSHGRLAKRAAEHSWAGGKPALSGADWSGIKSLTSGKSMQGFVKALNLLKAQVPDEEKDHYSLLEKVTEKLEEKVGEDIDGDNEKGEAKEHKKKVKKSIFDNHQDAILGRNGCLAPPEGTNMLARLYGQTIQKSLDSSDEEATEKSINKQRRNMIQAGMQWHDSHLE